MTRITKKRKNHTVFLPYMVDEKRKQVLRSYTSHENGGSFFAGGWVDDGDKRKVRL